MNNILLIYYWYTLQIWVLWVERKEKENKQVTILKKEEVSCSGENTEEREEDTEIGDDDSDDSIKEGWSIAYYFYCFLLNFMEAFLCL